MDRSSLTTHWTPAIVLALSLLALGLQACSASPPEQVPAASPVAQEQPRPPAAAAPAAAEMPASESPPPGQMIPAASPAPQVSPSASTSPSPDPAAAQRAEQEKRVRSELAAAKAKAESLAATADAECPDLKPGELRHPGAVSHCARLRSQAADALSDYETLKKEAAEAGITVP